MGADKMLFGSELFLFRFLPGLLILYFLTYLFPAAGRARNVILFVGSLLFFGWGEPVCVLLFLLAALLAYLFGLLIDRFRESWAARVLLFLSVSLDLAVLGFFRYSHRHLNTAACADGKGFMISLLYVGIAFYILQLISYTVDVYRGKVKAQTDLLDFGVFAVLFPQLVAGPVVRYKEIREQLHDRPLDVERISCGSRRFCIGLAKKILLADQLGLLWAEVLGRQEQHSVLMAWLGLAAFSLIIYFSLSGYADMAVGLGAVLGFHFPENFKYPYLASSVTEFWHKWFVTLGRWMRDYVYIPLGGNRKGVIRRNLNILAVWLLTGIWYGDGWNFLLWGLWSALFLVLEKALVSKRRKAFWNLPGFLYTQVVVLIGWAIFTISDPVQLGQYLAALFGFGAAGLYDSAALFLLREYAVLLVLALVAATPLGFQLAERMKNSGSSVVIMIRRFLEKLLPAVLLLASVAYIVGGSDNLLWYFWS